MGNTNQFFLQQYWQIWRDDYLKSLCERNQLSIRQPPSIAHVTLNVCDIVLVFNDDPRGSQQLAQIIYLIKSAD